MSCMLDMTATSLAAVVVPRIGKIIKNGLRVFERGLKRRKFATKWYTTPCKLANRQKRVTKLEFTETKNRLFRKRLSTN